jgi:branched-chain amino acid transport system substrate-binding protein
VGADLVNLVKQADEFNLREGRRIAGFVVFISDIHALTPVAAQGLNFAAGFQWNQSDTARAFSKRFYAERKVMPSKTHAAVYLGLMHYLKAMRAAGTRDAIAIGKAMRDTPVDYFGRPATLRSDGRLLYEVTLYRTKKPEEVKEPWDYCEAIGSMSADQAFLPLSPACSA